MDEKTGLKRGIGFWGFVSNNINIIVGAGIFILPAIVSENLGIGAIWAYLLSGGLMMLIMLCFADIGSKITITGGAYAYIEKTFGPLAGFITTNLFVFGAAVTANAAVANGLADTLSYFFPAFRIFWVRSGFFLLVFSTLALVNVRGLKQGMFVVNFNTIAKLLPLLMIVLAGWIFIEPDNLSMSASPAFGDIGQMALILIFAFAGSETALNVSGEIRNPKRNIPRGILVSMGIVLVLFILIQISAQGILGPELPNHRESPLAETAARMLGPAGATLVVLGAAFAMLGNLGGLVLNMPRLIFAAARDRVIPPPALARLHPKFATPHVAVIVYACLGCTFSILGEFRQLAVLSSASFLLIYLGVVLAVIRMRLKRKVVPGSYTVPGGLTIPILSILAIGWFLSNLSEKEIWGMVIFLVVLTLAYFIIRKLERPPLSRSNSDQ
jgi:amino acid transporter